MTYSLDRSLFGVPAGLCRRSYFAFLGSGAAGTRLLERLRGAGWSRFRGSGCHDWGKVSNDDSREKRNNWNGMGCIRKQ